jgi:hypothetical protein
VLYHRWWWKVLVHGLDAHTWTRGRLSASTSGSKTPGHRPESTTVALTVATASYGKAIAAWPILLDQFTSPMPRTAKRIFLQRSFAMSGRSSFRARRPASVVLPLPGSSVTSTNISGTNTSGTNTSGTAATGLPGALRS